MYIWTDTGDNTTKRPLFPDVSSILLTKSVQQGMLTPLNTAFGSDVPAVYNAASVGDREDGVYINSCPLLNPCYKGRDSSLEPCEFNYGVYGDGSLTFSRSFTPRRHAQFTQVGS